MPHLVNIQPVKDFAEYLDDLSRTVFVVSPLGNGMDCHRTWEALIMGCFPIVKSCTLNPLYQGLPVVIVNDWSEVTESFLVEKQRELSEKTWDLKSLFAPYWFQRVKELQEQIRQTPTSWLDSLKSRFEIARLKGNRYRDKSCTQEQKSSVQ